MEKLHGGDSGEALAYGHFAHGLGAEKEKQSHLISPRFGKKPKGITSFGHFSFVVGISRLRKLFCQGEINLVYLLMTKYWPK